MIAAPLRTVTGTPDRDVPATCGSLGRARPPIDPDGGRVRPPYPLLSFLGRRLRRFRPERTRARAAVEEILLVLGREPRSAMERDAHRKAVALFERLGD